MADPRLETWARVWIRDSQWSTVIVLVLHGDATSVGLGIGEQGGRVQTLVVHHGPTLTTSQVGTVPVTAAQGTRWLDDYVIVAHRGKQHRMTGTASASDTIWQERVVVISFGHTRSTTPGQKASPAKHAGCSSRSG